MQVKYFGVAFKELQACHLKAACVHRNTWELEYLPNSRDDLKRVFWQDYVYVRKYMNGIRIALCVVYSVGSVCMYLLFLCVCTCILIARCLMFSLVYIHINARMIFVHC